MSNSTTGINKILREFGRDPEKFQRDEDALTHLLLSPEKLDVTIQQVREAQEIIENAQDELTGTFNRGFMTKNQAE